MKIAFFSTKGYDRQSFQNVNSRFGHELTFFETRLTPETTALAAGFEAVCVFVNDDVNQAALTQLAEAGVKVVATRSAGYNQIDLATAEALGLTVVRVPAYSPNAVSEFTVGLILTLGRQIHRAYNRVRDNNFELEGLQGFELSQKTIGVFGTGRIGVEVIKNLSGFGARILAYDLYHNPEIAGLAEYVDAPADLFVQADILTLHSPLTPETHHLVNAATIAQMKNGVFLVNTSRGALLDTAAVIEGLKSGKIGYLAIDVYEVESDLFFRDLSSEVVQDDVFARLLTFPNVLVTGHQAFLTHRALANIAETTLQNFTEFEQTGSCRQAVTLAKVSAP
ncbi:MAG: 2-hydroxyacid dehydrogenase [Caldilineaceae bacterium]|nr:2-hydroxyacid dehydrogenase [Caldilineaceae bacterium]